jgi:hypothetical protein
MNTIAKLRPSQLITTFGIGCIVDAPDCSIMIAGQDFWRLDLTDVLHEPRLQRKLAVTEFRVPKPWKKPPYGQHENPSVPAVRFPLWHFCPSCRKLAELSQFGGTQETNCRACSTRYDQKRLVPSRFVVACEEGHICDFPWYWWVHRGAICMNAELEISSTGRSTTLGSITVRCRKCSLSATLERVFDPGELASITCRGNRPWLKDSVQCGKRLTVLQRGASNVYFSVTESAVSIPPFASATGKLIEKHWASLSIADSAEDNRGLLTNLAKREKKSFEDLWTAYLTRKTYGAAGPTPDIRLDEYQVLSAPPPMSHLDDFAAEAVATPAGHDWLERVVLVHRLRVVTALQRFSRLQSTAATAAPLARTPPDWLPAMEVHGEGIFLRPDARALDAWKQTAGKALNDRVNKLEQRRVDLLARGLRAYDQPITAELLLLHTLSHLLMRALVLDCGYSSAALREMLYVRQETSTGPAMRGFMIYTAAADSEGSLGGLVRQGQPDRLGSLLNDAIETARWCSNDPLCLESAAQGMNSLNLASCHSCSLVPETACEMFNGFLDRGVIVGTQHDPHLAFFPIPN